jgi:hypothetical protein
LLPDYEKKKIDKKKPDVYDEKTRELFLKSLENSKWPINIRINDIELFDQEITLANFYLKLIRKLKQHKKTAYDENSTNGKQMFNIDLKSETYKKEVEIMSTKLKKNIEKFNKGDKCIARNDLFGYFYDGLSIHLI